MRVVVATINSGKAKEMKGAIEEFGHEALLPEEKKFFVDLTPKQRRYLSHRRRTIKKLLQQLSR